MRLLFLSIVIAVGAVILPGCASNPSQVSDGHVHSECTVCKHNADLACIDVVVDPSTPHYLYNGKTYYFCSDHCCKKFQKDPKTYEKE